MRTVTAMLLAASLLPGADIRSWRQGREAEILREFTSFLSIPNVASDHANIGRNARWIVDALARRGVSARLLEHPGAPPVVYAELRGEDPSTTLILYAHYDGQPVEPEKWKKSAPFSPVLRTESGELAPAGAAPGPEWRIYGRSSSDDKAPIQALLSALDGLRAQGLKARPTVKLFFEGEEEAGSPHLPAIAQRYKDLLKADAWIVCDGPVDQSRRQQIYFGARGVVTVDVTLYGPSRELHSGHYGNWAPNPAMALAQLVGGMKDAQGRVTIPGFYDGIAPLSETETRAIREAPDNDEALRRELALGSVEGGRRLVEAIQLPSLNVRGFTSGSTGATARNVVPSTATASLDLRLVKGLDWKRAADLVTSYVQSQGYHVVADEPAPDVRRAHAKVARVVVDHGYNAARTSMDLPISKRVIAAIEEARGATVKMPTLGGSVPIYIFTDDLATPAIGLPIANHDNNQHAADENLRLQNLWDGIETMAALLRMR